MEDIIVKREGLIYRTLLYARSFFFLLAKIPFILLMLLVGFYAFYFNDQGQDMMASFSFMTAFRDPYISLVILFFYIWARTVWNTSRVLLGAANLKRLVENEIKQSDVLPPGFNLANNLIIADIDLNYKRLIEKLIKWVPRLLMLLPYSIFVLAYIKENGWKKPFNIIVVMLIATVHFVVLMYRRPLAGKIPGMRKKSKAWIEAEKEEAYSWEGKRTIEAIKKTGVVSNSWVTVISTVFVVGYAVIAAFSRPTDPGKPGLIILAGIIFYTIFGMIINLYSNRLRLPLFLVMVLFAVFIAAAFNNNHSIQVLSTDADTKMVAARKHDTTYCREWIEHKISKGVYDTSGSNTIFVVAAEGGGIRNCYWTYVVLQKLQNLQPSFYDHTFAVTGASGGSMGLGFYYNYIYHNSPVNSSNFSISGQDSARLDTICSVDYLSRVTYGFLFPDLFQRFIPWRIKSWDRGRYLANSFDDAFSGMVVPKREGLLSRNFQEMWSGNNLYDHPAILFNSTWAEGGSKALFSPYILSSRYYADAFDIFAVTKTAVPMKEGMLSSSRFPVLTPPGLMYYDPARNKHGKRKKLGHLLDGGIFENSGIQTAQQTVTMIKKELEKKGLSKKIKVVIIYIGFGTGSMAPPDNPTGTVTYKKALGNGYELSPVIAATNSIFRWIYAAHGLAAQLDPDMNVLEFGLRSRFDSTKHKLPLGLYLSATSKNTIRNEMRDQVMRPNLRRSIAEFNRYFNP